MSALERLRQESRTPAVHICFVEPADLAKALAVILAAQNIIDSGHNGNLYAREYDACHDALVNLTKED